MVLAEIGNNVGQGEDALAKVGTQTRGIQAGRQVNKALETVPLQTAAAKCSAQPSGRAGRDSLR
tara:strand:- start:1056 stop:1247 length:192 start_codon:yes stop_codon:yes gene_type:complete